MFCQISSQTLVGSFLDFREVKNICPHRFCCKTCHKRIQGTNNKLNKNKNSFNNFVLRIAANYLIIYHMFTSFICCNCIEFFQHCVSIYAKINNLLKISNFFCSLFYSFFFFFNRKGFYPNFTELSKNVTNVISNGPFFITYYTYVYVCIYIYICICIYTCFKRFKE